MYILFVYLLILFSNEDIFHKRVLLKPKLLLQLKRVKL